ncbi:hypothetical protein WJX84_011828 [Apatococcus fuscideae]|uniref:Uncharacterized protein n=1 Tax=Apatococcus fuscideae TaxID=2026836 RepID=A0AAW1T4H2_9CHLO
METRQRPKHPLIAELLTSGLSVSAANIATLPMDVLKVRLQLQTAQLAGSPSGLLMTGMHIIRSEGLTGLYRGLNPAVARGLFYGGVRLGCYTPIKTLLGADPEHLSLLRNIAAGSMSGAMAAAASNPMDLVKTQLQAQNSPFHSSSQVIRHVIKNEGLSGLWNGTAPSMTRAAVLTAAQCATYDEVKKAWKRLTGWEDAFPTHLASSLATGLVTTTITAPVDVVKTHMFMGGVHKGQSVLQCAAAIVKRDGMRGLLRGWTAQYVRLGPQTTVIFVVMEPLRKLSGLDAL